MIDDGPSPEDVERFEGETAFCPDCGEELWDQAEVCPHCHQFVGGEAGNRPPGRAARRRVGLILIVSALLAAMLLTGLASVCVW